MTKTTVHCDCCDAEQAQELSFRVGTQTDAAGSVEFDYKTLDLCPMHMKVAVEEALDFLKDHERERVYNQLKGLI